MKSPQVFLTFDNLDDALQYRKTKGCGGWVYEVAASGLIPSIAVICPVGMTPSALYTHPLLHQTFGKLHP